MKILIATISEATNTDLAKALSRYEVCTCATGPAALTMLETLRPDIMILDLILPAMDGLTVLRKSSFRPPTILARTNFLSPTVLRVAANLGVQSVLLIPSTTRYIVDQLDALIEKVPSPEA